MRDSLWIVLVVFHITFAASAIGLNAVATAALRRARSASSEVFQHVVGETNWRGKMSGIAGVLTLLSGLGLIFKNGGFGAVTVNFHIALGLILVMIALGFGFIKPTGAKLAAAAAKANDPKAPEVAALLSKLGIGLHVIQMLWFTILVLMFVKLG
jgi:hypothetical protein